MFELIRIESLFDREYFEKEQLQASSRPIKSRFVSNKCIILNRPTSRLRYRLFGVLSDIRWVVNNVFGVKKNGYAEQVQGETCTRVTEV